MAKRLTELGQEYLDLKREVVAAARAHNCPVDDIRLQLDYLLDNIEW